MDVQKELERWKADFKEAKTPEAQADHKKRFSEFVKSSGPVDGKAFVQAFIQGAKDAKEKLANAENALQIKKDLEAINEFTSMSYIAKHYFGKTRHWLYQRINGSLVNGKAASLTDEEKQKLVVALKDLGLTMNRTAQLIEQGL